MRLKYATQNVLIATGDYFNENPVAYSVLCSKQECRDISKNFYVNKKQ